MSSSSKENSFRFDGEFGNLPLYTTYWIGTSFTRIRNKCSAVLKNKDRYSQLLVSVFVYSKYLLGHQANNLAINPVMMPHNEKS